jgi:hypothetical protein
MKYILCIFIILINVNELNAQANQQLSNLSDTVAINRSLVPGSVYSNLNLGSSTYGWRHAYFAHTDSISPNLIYYRNHTMLHVTGGGTGSSDESLYLGEFAGENVVSTDGVNNGTVGIGYGALRTLGTGSSGASNLGEGNHNTAIGWLSMRNMNGSNSDPNQAADKNTMVGSRSGQRISAGRENTGVGYNVFYQGSGDEEDAYITGTGNTGIGGAVNVGSVSHGVLGLLTIGNYNTVVGYGSGISLEAGSNNLIVGDNAGVLLAGVSVGTAAMRNTIIGSGAGNTLTEGNDNILIGQNTDQFSGATASNQLNIGNSIFGNLATDAIGIGSTTLPSMFNVGASNQFQVSNTGRFAQYAGSTPANGQLLIGDGTDMELATLTEGSAIDVANAAASITIALDINELPTETRADVDEDFFALYDASESANNKMNLEAMLAAYVTEYRRNRFDYYNEFINGIGTSAGGNDIVSVNSDGGGSISAAPTTATNVVGLVRSSTGNTDATGRTSCSTGSSALALGGGTWTYELRINALPVLSNTETDASPEIYQVLVGFFDVNTTQNQTDGVYFLYDRAGVSTGSTATANWQTVTSSNANRNFVTTTTAVTTDATILKIVVNADATQVDFYLNDDTTPAATHTNAATIPDGANRACGFGWILMKSTGTANRAMDIDYLSAQCDYTTTK